MYRTIIDLEKGRFRSYHDFPQSLFPLKKIILIQLVLLFPVALRVLP